MKTMSPKPKAAMTVDELTTRVNQLKEKMSLLQDNINARDDSNLGEGTEENGTFPRTYYVMEFAPDVDARAIAWLIRRMRAKRGDGGAELLVRAHPSTDEVGTILHVSASTAKLLEIAETLELRKRDSAGYLRDFKVDQLEEFTGPTERLLTTAERQRAVRYEIDHLRSLPGDRHIPGYPDCQLHPGRPIVKLFQEEGLLTKLFPLHDRQKLENLGKKWWKVFFQTQPFEDIRQYFGEGIALYFGFLGFYTTALLAPALFGLILWLWSDDPLQKYTLLCCFNLIWVTLFLEAWKRKCAEMAFVWGTLRPAGYIVEPRAGYKGTMGIDPVTGRYLPQYPIWKTHCKTYLVSLPLVILWLLFAVAVMLIAFSADEAVSDWARNSMLPSMIRVVLCYIPSTVYVGVVWIMNYYYRIFATWLTEWENHRTGVSFQQYRVTKLILFQFVNNFSSLFYIAFYINDLELLRSQLAVMLIVYQAINHFQEALLPLVIRSAYKKVSEIAMEKLKEHPWTKDLVEPAKRAHPVENGVHAPTQTTVKTDERTKDWEVVGELEPNDPRVKQVEEERILNTYQGTYDDYLEMWIQFGYAFLFSSVFPHAALWAVLNNVLEIRADAFKLCRVFQRPETRPAKDIGAWQTAFEFLGVVAVITNCALLAMSSELRRLMPRASGAEWLLVFVAAEHIILAVKLFIAKVIPDVPEWVALALAKAQYHAKQALKNERRRKTRRQLTRRLKTIGGESSPAGLRFRRTSTQNGQT